LLTAVFTVLMYGYYTTVNLLKVNGSSFNDFKCLVFTDNIDYLTLRPLWLRAYAQPKRVKKTKSCFGSLFIYFQAYNVTMDAGKMQLQHMFVVHVTDLCWNKRQICQTRGVRTRLEYTIWLYTRLAVSFLHIVRRQTTTIMNGSQAAHASVLFARGRRSTLNRLAVQLRQRNALDLRRLTHGQCVRHMSVSFKCYTVNKNG